MIFGPKTPRGFVEWKFVRQVGSKAAKRKLRISLGQVLLENHKVVEVEVVAKGRLEANALRELDECRLIRESGRRCVGVELLNRGTRLTMTPANLDEPSVS